MEKLTEYELKIAKVTKGWSNDSLLIFRGQSSKGWGLNSGAERRVKDRSGNPGMLEYLTKHLIEPARSEGYGNQQNRELNDLELLAALQHQGAATCLIDFTANFHLALWFACEDPKNDGTVFVVNRGDIRTFREITPEQAKDGIEKLLKGETDTPKSTDDNFVVISSDVSPKIYYWKPPPNENRIVVQHSCFVFSFSLNAIAQMACEKITIPKQDKKAVRQLLEKFYGLDTRTVFRDLTGFAGSHGQGSPVDTPTVEWYFQNGNNHFRRGEYDRAIADFNEAITLSPDDAGTYYNRGIAYGEKGEYNLAIADYDKAIKLKPDYAAAYGNRGIAYARKMDSDRAIANYDEVIELKPDDARAYNSRGNAYSDKGEYDKAIADFNKAIELKPDYAAAYNNRGTAYIYKREYDKAIEDFNRAIELKPDYADAYNNRGATYSRKGEYDRAIADYTQAIKLDPDFTGAYHNRGIVHIYLEQWENAKKDLQAAKTRGTDISAWLGRFPRGVEGFERVTGIKFPPDIKALLTKP